MNRTVNCLQESGYVSRTADETDGRKVVISLDRRRRQPSSTETARRRDAWVEEALAELTPERARHPRRSRRDHAADGRAMSAMFRSFSVFNYRVWFIGALVSNIGAWMQATALSWVVLTELTDNDAAAMGITMALQFGPPLLLVGVTGWVADRFDRRKLLMVTQGLLLCARRSPSACSSSPA